MTIQYSQHSPSQEWEHQDIKEAPFELLPLHLAISISKASRNNYLQDQSRIHSPRDRESKHLRLRDQST